MKFLLEKKHIGKTIYGIKLTPFNYEEVLEFEVIDVRYKYTNLNANGFLGEYCRYSGVLRNSYNKYMFFENKERLEDYRKNLVNFKSLRENPLILGDFTNKDSSCVINTFYKFAHKPDKVKEEITSDRFLDMSKDFKILYANLTLSEFSVDCFIYLLLEDKEGNFKVYNNCLHWMSIEGYRIINEGFSCLINQDFKQITLSNSFNRELLKMSDGGYL